MNDHLSFCPLGGVPDAFEIDVATIHNTMNVVQKRVGNLLLSFFLINKIPTIFSYFKIKCCVIFLKKNCMLLRLSGTKQTVYCHADFELTT